MNLYQIKLQGSADTTAWLKATTVLHGLTDEANRFVDSLRAGVGIDIGGKIVNTLAEIPNIFKSTLERGVSFNKNIGDAEIGIGNVLAKFQDLDKTASQEAAAKAIAKIIELEPKSAATLQGLTQGFLATVAPAQAAGVNVEQNIDLVGKFANALANANIPAEQLSQELRAIFTGNITPDAALAKILSINNADIEKAKQAGKLYEFLNEQLGTLGESGDTAGVAFSTLESAVDKAAGTLAKPLFKEIIQGAKDLAIVLEDPAIVDALKEVGLEVGKVARTGVELTKWALQNADALLRVAKVVTFLGEAYLGLKLVSLVAGLARKAQVLALTSTAIQVETTALAANTAAQIANTAAKEAGETVKIKQGSGFNGSLGGFDRNITEVAYKQGDKAAESFNVAYGKKLTAGIATVMNNAGLVIAAGIAGWEIGKWIGDELESELDKAAAKVGAKSIAFDVDAKVKLLISEGKKEEAVNTIKRAIGDISKQLSEAERETININESWDFGTSDDLLAANQTLIASLKAQMSELEKIQTRQVAALTPQKEMSNAAALAASKQSELTARLTDFKAESGDLQAKLEALRSEYEKLGAAASKITGLNLDVAPEKLTGAIETQSTPDTFTGKDADKKVAAIEAQIKAGQELLKAQKEIDDANKKASDEIEQAQAEQQEAAQQLLELELRLAIAKGETAKAEQIKAELAKQKLADELVKSGASADIDEAGKKAKEVLDAEAAQAKKISDDKRVKAQEEEALDRRLLEARAAGNEAQAKALEEELAIRRESVRLQESLGLSAAEATAQAAKKVALERQADALGKRNVLDDKFDAVREATKTQQRRPTSRGLAEFEELQSRTTRSTFRFPALDAFQAFQNDPRRRAPVSSVSDRVVGPQIARPGQGGIAPAAGLQNATNALQNSGTAAERKLGEVTTALERVTRLMADRSNAANGNYAKMAASLRQVEASLKQEIAAVQASVKNNRA